MPCPLPLLLLCVTERERKRAQWMIKYDGRYVVCAIKKDVECYSRNDECNEGKREREYRG